MYKLTPTLQIMYRFTPTIHMHTTDSTAHVQTSTSIGSTHSNHPHSLSPVASSRARATAERDRHGFPSLCRTAADPLVPTSPRARPPRQPHRRRSSRARATASAASAVALPPCRTTVGPPMPAPPSSAAAAAAPSPVLRCSRRHAAPPSVLPCPRCRSRGQPVSPREREGGANLRR